MKKETAIKSVCAIALGGIGAGVIAYFAGWGVVAGVFLMIWGNNVDRVIKQTR